MQQYITQQTGYTVKIVEKPLYDPSPDIDFSALFRWVTGRSPSDDDRDRILAEFMSGVEGKGGSKTVLYKRGHDAFTNMNQN